MAHTPRKCTLLLSAFETLPAELRLEIWRLVCDSNCRRIVEITFNRSIGNLVSLSPPPALLGICRESRAEAFKMYRKLSNSVGAPPIYLDLQGDILLIREDSDGILAKQNLLLRNIFGSQQITPFWDLSMVRHLAIDYWIVEKAVQGLACLASLHNVQDFCIVMAGSGPQSVEHINNPARTVAYSQKSLINVGFEVPDIEQAVQSYWGMSGEKAKTAAIDINNVLQINLMAEIAYQQSLIPRFGIASEVVNVVSYG